MSSHFRFAALCLALASLPAYAQEEAPEPDLAPPILEAPSLEPQATAVEGAGAIAGTVFSNADANPELGVAATLIAADGSELGQATTDAEGKYRFDDVPAGTYSIRFEKPGFRTARMTEFPVIANQDNPGDFAISPDVAGTDSGVEEIVITAERRIPVADRANVDEFINTMDTAEIGKFAATDIGEAIKRIPGINVVEGQFAVIRGLEDRYSSTLFNSAPVPSPDPESQSVQLDLFPSEITSNLVVAKTFASDLPGNSSGGSINILTHQTPESDLELKLNFGAGFNENAMDHHISPEANSPIGSETDGTTEGEFGAVLGWQTQVAERELTVRGLFNWELDYATLQGYQEGREPKPSVVQVIPAPGTVVQSGDLSLGELSLSSGRFDFTESGEVRQTTAFVDVGVDVDPSGSHHVDFSVFYSKKEESAVQLREDGYIPGFDYGTLSAIQAGGGTINPGSAQSAGDFGGYATLGSWITAVRPGPLDPVEVGPLWFANFNDSRTFERDRDLLVVQLNGTSDFDSVPGLRTTWAANYATTNQDESYLASRYFFEPADPTAIPANFPVTASDIAPGQFAGSGFRLTGNTNLVEEDQWFFRLDAEYERELADWVLGSVTAGFWYEDAQRGVEADFLETATNSSGTANFTVLGDTPLEYGRGIYAALGTDASGGLLGSRGTSNDSSREVIAGSIGAKATLWEILDLLAGLRIERLRLESRNDPFYGEFYPDGTPRIFPTAYLFFDRPDNPVRAQEYQSPPGSVFNDQVIGVSVPIDPVTGLVDFTTREQLEGVINGEVDERLLLPSAGLTVRPIEGLNLRAAYSQTSARPSLREMGYYISVESGSDDLVVGNPQLRPSDVESWDVRAEYVWGGADLAAFSVFVKKIEEPIESVVLRDPIVPSNTGNQYRTFFNNPDTADLWGLELEGRKALDFLGSEFLEYVSIAANFTYIDAQVKRSDLEIARAATFFGVAAGDTEVFPGLKEERRLFSQPEWISNGDITLDYPDWGTKCTLSVFAISDVLDAVGSANIAFSGVIESLTLDRYIDGYYQMDLTASQELTFDRMPGVFTLKASVKNLTDSTRQLIWDPSQTSRTITERSYKIGRDVAFSLNYSHAF